MKYSKLKSAIHYFKEKKPAPSGLIIEFGARGSGKSTDIAKKHLQFYQDKKSPYIAFYTNIELNTLDPNYYHLDLINYKLTDYLPITEKTINAQCYTVPEKETPFKIQENSIICIDELGIVAHARDFKNFPKEFIHFVKYLRKMGILLVCNSQSYDIDKTLREGASDLRLKRKVLWWSFSRKINKKIVCSQSSKKQQTIYKAEDQIHDELKFAFLLSKDALHVTFIPFYVDHFNSFK